MLYLSNYLYLALLQVQGKHGRKARATNGRYERQGHEQIFIFSFIYILTILFVYICPGCEQGSTQAK